MVAECLVIRSRLSKVQQIQRKNIGETFQKLMLKGNVNGALPLLTSNQCNGLLPLNDETMNELHLKHPDACPINDDLLLQGTIKNVNDVIFESIDNNTVLWNSRCRSPKIIGEICKIVM